MYDIIFDSLCLTIEYYVCELINRLNKLFLNKQKF